MMRGEGDELPVSAFKGMEDGTHPPRAQIAVMIPQWH